jgi:spore coat polysaccharide biosynthesis predicted glycosyltransferase SpsG
VTAATASPVKVRVLFRLAAGARLGFGHLVRGRTLARALEISQPDVSLRGSGLAHDTAERFGLRLVQGAPLDAIRATKAEVLVVDDPSRVAALRWRRAAGALGVPVVSVHDLGNAFCDADLAIDGSIVPPSSRPRALMAGPEYAILDSSVVAAREQTRDPNSILIALGGGPRLGVALEIARALRNSRPELRVRIAAGFGGKDYLVRFGIVCLGPRDGLANELARCAVAITGGGVSLYEAAALDTPSVAWPVVKAQHATVKTFHRRGLAIAVLPGRGRITRAIDAVHAHLTDLSPRRTSQTIDGRGAERVADAIRALARRGSKEAA